MSILDVIVFGLYGLGMLAIGVFFSRRTSGSDDYMLGGRKMPSWAVGLSLFATLFSALTYLAHPGEMIRHGPMINAGLVAFPFFYVVVGWLLIPRVMKQNVSSAYELLEAKLGLLNRLLASTIFLAMRLVWMAMIIYMASDKVIVPVLGWSPDKVAWVCVGVGLLTVVYTSLGGIRAVICTDVIQSFILFAGAILTVALIVYRLGGVGAIIPDTWPAEWDKPALLHHGENAQTRTFFGAFIAFFFWYVCTAGSDQMAIQRYLATRDVRAARRAFLSTVLANGLVLVVLAVVGVSLFAFFKKTPELLPAGTSLIHNADMLFPLFITEVIPPGIRALVIAGLLAAAMSSLSSGVNSSALVILRDFICRLRPAWLPESRHVHVARYISFGIGVIVILLSLIMGRVRGNLTEQVFRTVNLLVAPLFVPFLMCLFIPRATPLGAFVATMASILAAVAIAYWEPVSQIAATLLNRPGIAQWHGIGFLWITPASFAVGAVVGGLFSLVSFGQNQPKKERMSTDAGT